MYVYEVLETQVLTAVPLMKPTKGLKKGFKYNFIRQQVKLLIS